MEVTKVFIYVAGSFCGIAYVLVSLFAAAMLWDPDGETRGPGDLYYSKTIVREPEPKWMFWAYFIGWPIGLFVLLILAFMKWLLDEENW